MWGIRKRVFSGKLFLLAGMFAGVLLWANQAQAVQINRVQSGTIPYANIDIVDTATLAYAVDPAKSIILINTSADGSVSTRDGNYLFTPYFEDSEHIALSRDYGACAANVSFQVVEFNDGVKVIHGFSSMDKDTKVKTVNLPSSVNSANAFVLVYTRGYITTSGDTEVLFLKADLISDTQIQLTRLRSAQEAGITRTINITYQVVEFETDAVIKKGLDTIAYNQYSQTATVNPAITDITKSFLVFNFVGGAGLNGVESQMLPRGTITDTSTLTFVRGLNSGGTTDYVDIKWYLVELTDESSLAQKGTATLNGGTLTGTATLSLATDLTRTAVFTSVDANTTSTTNSYLDDCSNRVAQTNGTTVTFTREESVVRNDIDWFAVEFAPLTLKIPNGGEVWQVGDTEDITWVHAASLETGGSCVDAGYVGHHLVDLKLSMNSGGDNYPLTIISGIRGTLDTYAWTIPAEISGTDIIGEQLKVQIIDTDMTVRNYDVSNNDLIIKGTITINQPPNTWKIGDTNAITWTYTGNLQNLSPNTVTITLSTDGSSFLPTAIIANQIVGASGNGSYNWDIPSDWDGNNLITTTNRLKILLNYDPSTPDTIVESTSTNFTLKGQIYEVSPITEEMWLLGETKTISWTKKGHFGSGITDGTVNIYYSYNDGLSYESMPIASDVAAGTDALGGTYDWTIPNSTYLSAPLSKLKVVSTSDATVSGESASFTIMSSLDVNRPLGSEVWRVGQTEDVKWTIHGAMDYVVIKYKVGAGDFEYLNGAEPADLLPAGTPEVEQIFSWFIPDNIGTNNVYLRVCNKDNENVYDEVGPFSIKGTIGVSEPHASEIINLGDTKNIQWNVSGSMTGNVNIRLSKNGGTSYLTLINTVPVTPASYSWSPLAADMGTNNKIKVALDGDENLLTGTAGQSDTFSVEANLDLVYPNASGLVFNIGNVVYIKWTADPTTFGMVNIRYSTDGGANYNGFIADGVASDANPGSGTGYLWTIPDVPGMVGTACRVQVYQVGKQAEVHSESQYNFTVKGTLDLTAPVGGETWYVDQFNSITWTKGGDLGTLKLAYSKDGGSDGYGSVIATGVAANDLSFPWQVADAIGTQLKVKISQETDPTTNDVSTTVFTIKGRIVLSAPIGGETWLVGNSENISWTTYGTISNVNIYYSTDGGGTYGSTIATNLSNIEAFLWTIPDAIDTDIRVKVESFYDSTVAGESVGNFTVKGQVRVTAPNGGEKWRVDATENITWVVNGSIGNVKIEYSTNSGASYDTVIVASTPGLDQTYAWTNIPDIIGTALRIKITSLSNGTVLDESDADFEIKGVLTLSAPNGTEIWKVGASENITWTKKGTLGNVELRYSTDSGATFPVGQTIVTGIASTATPYAWTIPDRIGTGLRVQVSLLSDPTNVLDASDADFEIKGNLALTAPVGGEDWEVGTSKQITWNLNGSIALVKIEYSNDGGNTYPNTITNGTSAIARTYNWTIPDDIGSLLRVKISDASDAEVNDISPANFNIKGKLVLSHPNGGETLNVGQAYTIDWTTAGTINTVNLYYSVNSGSSYDTSIVTGLSNINSYAWTVPDAIGNQLRVKVENPDNTNVADVSNADFTIKGKLTLTVPNGGETWIVDDSQNITWTKQGTISTVKLDYSINGGATYDYPIATGITAADISYAWTVADAIGNNLMIRITNEADNTVKDESNAAFTIKGSVAVTSPNGGESWTIGSAQDITWTKHGTIGNISILYSTDGGTTYPLTVIGSTASAGGTYNWPSVPDSPSTTTKVKITCLSDASVADESNSNFRIRADITLTAPNGGESWVVGTSENITWVKTGSIANVALEYSINNGLTYPNAITTTSGEALSSSWTIPDAIGTQIRVKVRNTADASVYDESNANFSIKGSVTTTVPNGGEVFVVGSAYDIQWTYVGSIPNMKLEYSINGGSTFPYEIIASTPAVTLSYEWTVPDTITNQLVVRVSDAADATVSDVSNAFAKIKGSLTITAPNGSENLTIGDSTNITWTRTGTLANVKLEYSVDGGTTYPNQIVTDLNSSLLTYSWTIPDSPTTLAKVKITSLDDSTVTDASNANFSIKGSIDLTVPNGGQIWIVGATQAITWTKFGSISLATLEYSVNGGTTYPNVINNSVSVAALTYNWLIPDAIGTQLRVRITNNADATVTDESAADFEIKGSVTMTAPNGSEIWLVGESRNITWTYQGSIGNIKLEYSKDAGSTYIDTITPGVPVTNLSYSWTVPDAIGNQLRIKVTSVNDAAVNDQSNNNFTIKGILTLTVPNGAEEWIVGSSHNITWNRTGTIANVKLEYSTDGGTSYSNEIIASTSAAAGTYSWTIPDAIDSDIRVRVSDVTDASVNDVSNADFTIKGSLTLTAPNGGESWVVGTSNNITWTKQGSITNVELRYSVNGGTSYDTVI
ncbi:MAG: hypothetical protein V1747_08340, partial [Candidatus Omnitrophota bacterium]